METIWALRPDARWQDGQPFTADDVVFGWQLATDPDMPLIRSGVLDQLDRVEAVDAHSVRMLWKSTYYHALDLGVKELSPLPTHLLQDTYINNKSGLLNLPYWTTEYVHLGPFRLVDFGLGESLLFERFDAFFLGRPKLDRVRVQVIADENVLYSNLLAGTVDLAPVATLTDAVAFKLRDEWQASGDGTVYHSPGNLNFLAVQFDPAFSSPPELAQDPRIRLGLFLGLDRDAIREALYPGVAGLAADSFLPSTDPRSSAVGTPFARYQYDPRLAQQTLADAGWRAGADGRLVRASGEPVQLAVRGVLSNANSIAIVADQLRQLGIASSEETVPAPLVLDREYRAHFTGLDWGGREPGDGLLLYFLASQVPTAQNRYGGGNRGSYLNPVQDRLVSQLYTTLDIAMQAAILQQIDELWAEDFPVLPLHFTLNIASVRKGVHALADDFAGANEPGGMARNAHLWDIA